jgi:hypothetical protein
METVVCLLVGLVCFYLGEIAPFQGIVASKVFSGKDPSVVGAWTAVQWLIRLIGLSLSAFLAWKVVEHMATRKWIDYAVVSIVCAITGVVTPYLMSQLVGTIRDAFLLSK